MFHKSRILQTHIVLALVMNLLFGGILLPESASVAFAQTVPLELSIVGPTYVQPGKTITYALTVKNMTNQVQTNIKFFNDLPENTTYVSGGTLIDDTPQYVEFTVPSLAANASRTLTWVVKVDNGTAVGTVIDNSAFNFIPSSAGNAYGGASTLVEAPGTLVAVYKNGSGRAFDVTVDGYQFENYSNDAPRNFNDDLKAADVFTLFGPDSCQSGNTAATCVLSGPAKSWLSSALKSPNGGHCDGMASTSLRLFNSLPYGQYSTPATFQPGATSTINLNFPAQPIENYITHYFSTQSFIWDSHFAGSPVAIVQKLTTDFNHSPSIGYTVSIFTAKNLDRYDDSTWELGHSIVAYGIETVSANESRILVYDNNFPKQRQYITVNMAANTWRYVTAATPGQDDAVYTGSAVSENLRLVPLSARDLPAGQYFECPFCNQEASSASIQAAALGMIAGTIEVEYTGEGAILVVNDEDQSTGFAFDTETFINEIPDAEIFQFQGGLGKDIPPRIVVPFVETDETLYSVFISGKTITDVADGALIMTGDGYAMGLDSIALDPDEFLELVVSPDGDFIAFRATQTVAAPSMYISYDPVSDQDPSIIFNVDGVILDPGEESSLTLDPDLERVYFDDTGALGQQFDVAMTFIWPDGDEEVYTETIDVPAGSTSAFVDFGAWDGLLDPSTYVDDILQNPLANHRIKLESSAGTYDPTPQANAPFGVYHVEATFANVTEVVLNDVYFTVGNLGEGNLLLNANGGPAGVGSEILVPAAALGDNGFLDANETFTLTFDVGLVSAGLSDLTVDANGEPWDWTPNADPAPTYDANNASFVFAVRSESIFLPLITR